MNITGTLGGSAWVLMVNMLLFKTIRSYLEGNTIRPVLIETSLAVIADYRSCHLVGDSGITPILKNPIPITLPSFSPTSTHMKNLMIFRLISKWIFCCTLPIPWALPPPIIL